MSASAAPSTAPANPLAASIELASSLVPTGDLEKRVTQSLASGGGAAIPEWKRLTQHIFWDTKGEWGDDEDGEEGVEGLSVEEYRERRMEIVARAVAKLKGRGGMGVVEEADEEESEGERDGKGDRVGPKTA